MSDSYIVTGGAQKLREHVRRVAIVVDDDEPMGSVVLLERPGAASNGQ